MGREAIANGDYYAIDEKIERFYLDGHVSIGGGFSIYKIQVFNDKGQSIWANGLPLECIVNINMTQHVCGVNAKTRKYDYRLIFKNRGDIIKAIFEVLK